MKIILCATILAAGTLAAELPVREVILYKNGIGYFVRSGEVKAGEAARLEFKTGEMNDVLKSLVIFEDGGGKISGLRYDASEPLATKLAEFPFQLGDHQALSALLDQVKGARVELKTGPETVAGSVVGAREIAAGEKQPHREEVNLLLDSGELRTVDLGGVTAMRFSDPVLQGQLVKYLARVAAGRSKEKRGVTVDSTSDRARRLTASYVVPAPVWKSSYRLAFTDAAEPTLEGWAIVDNTTGEDWTKVRLALVSGRPVSFITNLYEPRMVARQNAELPEEEAEAPELYSGAVAGGVPGGTPGGVVGGILPPSGGVGGGTYDANRLAARKTMAKLEVDQKKWQNETVAYISTPEVQAAERGELFEYRFDNPISVRDGESAMLPFLQQKVTARKLLIFSTAASEFPRNATEITNNTGKTLDGGPITVFDGNTYAGEALMETVKAGDKRLVSYAVDLGTRVATKLDSSSDVVREIHVRRGVLTVRTAQRETKTYTVHNVDAKAKTLIVEHSIRQGYRVVKPEPSETTASAYRFEVKLAAQATAALPVTEERLMDQSVTLANTSSDFLGTYIQNKDLNEAARKQLERIAGQKRLIAENDGAIQRGDQDINSLVQDQDRLRQNISTLNQVSGQQEQVQTYARRLSDQEAQLATLRDHQKELKDRKTALQGELNKTIEALEF
ncbi:MAG TPA: DUF4139 domain-containing protein [Bryobacteraceae bacterium]|nr:DUF4139 domain-containing protein [Bryobacteraceae bacterium]